MNVSKETKSIIEENAQVEKVPVRWIPEPAMTDMGLDKLAEYAAQRVHDSIVEEHLETWDNWMPEDLIQSMEAFMDKISEEYSACEDNRLKLHASVTHYEHDVRSHLAEYMRGMALNNLKRRYTENLKEIMTRREGKGNV